MPELAGLDDRYNFSNKNAPIMKISRVLSFFRFGGLRGHFSQFGEDIFLRKQFRGRKKGFYVDVGAHHPFQISNTALLWLAGWHGVNIDASKSAIELFKKVRKDDLNIWAAAVPTKTHESQPEISFFYSRDIDNMATCDPTVAASRERVFETKVPTISLKNLIADIDFGAGNNFELLNIDIEGLDEAVLEDISSWKKQPEIIMIELYGETMHEVIALPIVDTLRRDGYDFIARTGHTAIFMRSDR